MIKIFKSELLKTEEILSRELKDNSPVEATIKDILNDVSRNGDQAVFKYTKMFDGATIENLIVSKEEIEEAFNKMDPYFVETLQQAAKRIANFHKRQKSYDYMVNEDDGIVLGQKVMPLQRVGIYVPGGTASYPSSVLMNAIPAKIAGVKEICMATPPGKDGTIYAPILAAAKIAGVDKIYKMGGAQAIAAFAYGTQTVIRVDKIVGPGNKYVAAAKRRVFGLVDIDMVAGPSEILVIADAECKAKNVAADLLSQAEHDIEASAVLLTNSEKLANQVQAELERQIPLLPRADICRKSIDNNGKIIITKSIEQAVEISNIIAPEHLELCVSEPFALLNSIKNAGSIFLGRNVPEPLGDYFAGPNHTLPTNGTARFSSPLGVEDFQKRSSIIYYSEEALYACGDRIIDFAQKEGLEAHANSIRVRMNKD